MTEVLVGVRSNRVHKPSDYQYETTCAEMSTALGGVHNKGGLVLADKQMNGRKNNIMQTVMPSYQAEETDKETRLMHRNVS